MKKIKKTIFDKLPKRDWGPTLVRTTFVKGVGDFSFRENKITCCEDAQAQIADWKKVYKAAADIAGEFAILREGVYFGGVVPVSPKRFEFKLNYCPICGRSYKKNKDRDDV